MDSYIERLETGRQHAVARLRSTIDTAETERRSLTPEEQQDADSANEAIDRYSDEIKRITNVRAKQAEWDALRPGLSEAVAATRGDSLDGPTSTANGWLQRAKAQSIGEWATTEDRRTIPLGYETRALGSSGGSAIATTFADFVTVFERTLNPMIDAARVISTTSGAPLTFPRVTGDVVAGGSVTAEAAGITESDPTISQVTLGAFKIASTTIYSFELEQDNVIGLDSILADAIARPIGLGWGTYFTLGTGTTQPFGFLARATNGGTALGTASGNAGDKYFSASDLVDLFYSLAAPYRVSGSWMTNSVAKMRKFKDNNNQFIWTPGNIAIGQPDTFLGRPVYENPVMLAAGSANTAIAFGDFSRYYIRDVQPMRVDISRDYKFNTDQLALRVITRRDADLVDNAAVKFLVSQAI